MRAIAIDTNAYVGFKRGDLNCLEVFQNADPLLISTIVLGELLAGFACGNREGQNRVELERFLAAERVQLMTCGMATAGAYAGIFRQLRMQGRPIPSHDIWIAANCLERGAPLFSFDAHFRSILGLRCGQAWADLALDRPEMS